MSVNSFEGYYMSWKPEINKSDKALYRSLAAKLESDIKNGILMPGTKLPPQRELADFLDLNLSTVSKAFKLCELKGLISATAGSGTLVAYDALTRDHLVLSNVVGIAKKSYNSLQLAVLINILVF